MLDEDFELRYVQVQVYKVWIDYSEKQFRDAFFVTVEQGG